MCDPRMPGCFLLRALCDVWTVEWRTIDALRALLCGPFYWAIFGLDLMLIFLVPNDRADLSRSGSTQRATTGGSPDPKNGIPSTLYRGEKSRILRTRIGRQYLAEVKIDVDGDITRNRNG